MEVTSGLSNRKGWMENTQMPVTIGTFWWMQYLLCVVVIGVHILGDLAWVPYVFTNPKGS